MASEQTPPQSPCQIYYPPTIPHESWVQDKKDLFHRLIQAGESQPSNGTVRQVDPPNGDTSFALAYGDGPDANLELLLHSIAAVYGQVLMRHDGRDSTGKHWIRCYADNAFGLPTPGWEKADICVYSKLEIATVPPPRTLGAPGDGKDEESIPDDRERPYRVLGAARWPPKVPDAVEGAPDNLYLLPWFEHVPWLEPAAAEALREKKKAQREAWEEAVRQAQAY